MCFVIFKFFFYSLVVRFEIVFGCFVIEIKNMEFKLVICIVKILLRFAIINLFFIV